MPKVSINLVAWNGEKQIRECLNSLLDQSLDDFLLLIIDNGSVDKTVKIIEEEFITVFGERLKFVKNKNNLGFAYAHNQAMLWTDSDYVMVLNQDVILDKFFLEKAVDFMEKTPDCGSVNGKVLRWHFSVDELKKGIKTDIIDTQGLKIYKSQKVEDLNAGKKDIPDNENVKLIFGVSAACPLYRREALNDVRFADEFFDNDFFSYKEDVDLAYRLAWRGWKSFYLPQCLAYHERTAKMPEKGFWKKIFHRREKSRFVNFYSYKNHFFLLYKNLSLRLFFRYFFSIVPAELNKIVYLIFFERNTLRGLFVFLDKRKKLKKKRSYIMKRRTVKDEAIRQWFCSK